MQIFLRLKLPRRMELQKTERQRPVKLSESAGLRMLEFATDALLPNPNSRSSHRRRKQTA